MTRIHRGRAENNHYNHVDMVYYMVEDEAPEPNVVPNFTSPERVVYLSSLFSEHEVVLALGYPVISVAERECPPPPPSHPVITVAERECPPPRLLPRRICR